MKGYAAGVEMMMKPMTADTSMEARWASATLQALEIFGDLVCSGDLTVFLDGVR